MSTLVGGGRYDGLIEQLGGKTTPGVGFGMGIERVIENVKRQEIPVPDSNEIKVLVAHQGDNARSESVKLASNLRRSGVNAVAAPMDRSLRSQLRYASSINSTHAVIIGDDELAKGVVSLRNLVESEQIEVRADELVAHLMPSE